MVATALSSFGRLDIVVNNAAQQYPQKSIEDITEEQLTEDLPHQYLLDVPYGQGGAAASADGARIINTTSVTAYRGSPHLLDYSATKGAIVAFTRSLSQQLVERGIRVNAVAPGPVWTPLIPASFDAGRGRGFRRERRRWGGPDSRMRSRRPTCSSRRTIPPT